jgi:aspartate kinase
VAARSLRGGEAGIAAEGPFGAGAVAGVDPGPVLHLFRGGVVPVVSGFQGFGEDGETRTLGRGGSDLTAVALAAALGRVPCHLVKDVPAVFDRDPRLDPAAVPLLRLEHAALLEIAEQGGQVVHPEAARLALSAGVPLRVYHFLAPLSGRGGTVVRAPHPRVPVEVA